MTILDKIVADKYQEIALKKALIPTSQLEQSVLFGRSTVALSKALKNSTTGIIAEHKRRSPSKSIINQNLNVQDVAKAYYNAGGSGMSILTDSKYFGGSLDDLLIARASSPLPLLRKEFIIDEYQILEAKAYGADVVLLIAAILKQSEIKQLSEFAKRLGLEVLLEVHNEEELHKSIMPSLDMIGVNNRNLKTFNVDISNSKNLSQLIPNDFVKVSESGISETKTIKTLQTYGYQGFLIGETFMKTDTIEETTTQFIAEINKTQRNKL